MTLVVKIHYSLFLSVVFRMKMQMNVGQVDIPII